MSTAHLSLDDFAFPGHKPHQSYELSYALGAPHQPASLYPHAGLDAPSVSPHSQAHYQHIPPDAAHSAYLPDHPENFLTQYYVGMGYPSFDAHLPPYSMAQRPPSPRSLYTANSGWGAPEGYGAPADPAASSSSFLHNLQNVIESSHTSQVHQQQQQQQHNAMQAQGASPQSVGPSSSSWALSGSLDPATGVFQRTVEHPRLRTAQACEKCRVRKAKCSGDHPACQRCVSRGLQCEYAPERKMRGPNKQKRKSVSQKHESSPTGDRRSSIASISSTISSSSDLSGGMDANAAAAAAAVAAVNGSNSRPSSRVSQHLSLPPSPVRTETSRPRSTTIALGAIQRAAEYTSSPLQKQHGAGPPVGRQRPPPLDLSDTRPFGMRYPPMLAQYTRGGEPIGAYGPASAPGYDAEDAVDARRTSLPPYLLEAYSRIGYNPRDAPQHDSSAFHEPSAFVAQPPAASFTESSDMARSGAHDPYMHPAAYTSQDMDLGAYLQSSPADALSVYSNPRSNSSDVSAPITPLSLSDSGSAFDPASAAHGELAYPADYAAFDAVFAHAPSAEPEAPQHSFDGMQMQQAGMEPAFRPKSAPEPLGGQWDVAMDDETPRADGERKLSHVGRLMADVGLS